MTCWEYFCATVGRKMVRDKCNELGKEGWELVNFIGTPEHKNDMDLVFKRPIPDLTPIPIPPEDKI
jgi:hypothetical protein